MRMRTKTRTRKRKRVTGSNDTSKLVCTCDLFRIYLTKHNVVVPLVGFDALVDRSR